MDKQLNKQLDMHLNTWVENSQSLSWSLVGKPFFSVDDDSEVIVNLLLLSESYRIKHIDSSPEITVINFFIYWSRSLHCFCNSMVFLSMSSDSSS